MDKFETTHSGTELNSEYSVGERLQIVRKQFGLSQRELARRADVANGMLSMVEQGKVSPSVASLEKILHAIPITLQEFFSNTYFFSEPVHRESLFTNINTGGVQIRIMPRSGSLSADLELCEYVYDPGAKLVADTGEKRGTLAGLVIEGELSLSIEGRTYTVKKGDGFDFALQRAHSFNNHSDHITRAFCVKKLLT